jgi:chemotaxis protein MotB
MVLETQNQSLMDQLQRGEDDLLRCQAQGSDLSRQLADARNESNSLRGQLASRPMTQPQPVTVQQPRQPEPVSTPAGWQKVPGATMIAIEGSVLFNPGKVSVRSEAQRTLDDIASTIRSKYSKQEVYVYGHTDDTPIKKSGWKDNYELSAQRALAVVRDLQSKGINPERLVAAGCGEHRPKQSGSSVSARKANRRVEIFVLDEGVRTASSR